MDEATMGWATAWANVLVKIRDAAKAEDAVITLSSAEARAIVEGIQLLFNRPT